MCSGAGRDVRSDGVCGDGVIGSDASVCSGVCGGGECGGHGVWLW